MTTARILFYIALNHAGDINHQQACNIAIQLTGFRFVVTDAVITETYTLLRYRIGFHVARRFLDIVLNDEDYDFVEITSRMRIEVMQKLEKYSDHKISYCDALSVVAMKHCRVEEIFAFDHHFEMMGMKLVR